MKKKKAKDKTPLELAKERAEKDFKKWIKDRDDWTCQFCGQSKQDGKVIQWSHYWPRGDWNVRFDPENVDSLCQGCHYKHEKQKQGFYREFKLKQLVPERYEALEARASISIKQWLALEQCGEVVHGDRDYYYPEVVK